MAWSTASGGAPPRSSAESAALVLARLPPHRAAQATPVPARLLPRRVAHNASVPGHLLPLPFQAARRRAEQPAPPRPLSACRRAEQPRAALAPGRLPPHRAAHAASAPGRLLPRPSPATCRRAKPPEARQPPPASGPVGHWGPPAGRPQHDAAGRCEWVTKETEIMGGEECVFWIRGSMTFSSLFLFSRNLFRTIIELQLTALINRGKQCLQFRKPGGTCKVKKIRAISL